MPGLLLKSAILASFSHFCPSNLWRKKYYSLNNFVRRCVIWIIMPSREPPHPKTLQAQRVANRAVRSVGWDTCVCVCVCRTDCCRKGQFGRLSSPQPSSSPSLTLLSSTIKLNLLLSTLECALTVLFHHLSLCTPYTVPIHSTCPLQYKGLTSVTYMCLYQWAHKKTYWVMLTSWYSHNVCSCYREDSV